MTQKLISFDWAIKRLLRNKANFEILEGFLSELIAPDKNVKIIKLLESESNKNSAENKLTRVDILVEIEPDDIVLIEVQVSRELDFLHRMLFGTSKVIAEHLAEGIAYAKVKKVYSVNILYFDLGHGKDYVYRGTTDFIGIHNQEQLQLNERQKGIYKKELISEIYPEYYLIKVNNFNDLAKNTLDEWIYFLKNEEIKPSFHAKGLLKAKKEFDILNLPEEERKAYEKYQDNLHYEASMIDSSYGEGKYEGKKEGIEEGKVEGREERNLEIASNMLKKSMPIIDISELTGLSIETIEKLTKNS